MVWPTTEILQKRGESASSFLNRLTRFREGDEEGWFSRFDQLTPLIDFSRATVEAVPAIAASTHYLTCVLVDEDVAQGPGVRTEEQGIYSCFSAKSAWSFNEGRRKLP
jgi:hypothetical protein